MNSNSGAWFIDGRLIYKAAKEDGQFIQFKKLRHLVEHEFKLPLRPAFYFDGAPMTEADKKRHNYLNREVGLRVKSYVLGRKISVCPECHAEIESRPQKCVDIELAISIIEFAMKSDPVSYNPIVLSTGDRDFVPVLEKVRDEYDKDIILIAPRKATAAELVPLTTRQIWIEDHYSSIADRWKTRVAAGDQQTALGEAREESQIPAEEALVEAKRLILRVWDDLQMHEKPFPNGGKGRPWGYMLLNFGRLAEREGKCEKLHAFLVERDDGQQKGANALCLELARQMWPRSEIQTNGHPHLVRYDA